MAVMQDNIKYNKDIVDQAYQRYLSGISRDQVAKEFNIPTGSLSYLMKKFGYSLRPKGFQLGNKTSSQFKTGQHFCIFCKNCNKEISVPSWQYNKRKYCSSSCRSSFNSSKEKHWNWQGGISDRWDSLHNSIEYKNWRMNVFFRDKFLCQVCNASQNRNNPLHAHHIKPKKDFPELILDVNNGMTVCKSCHINIHNGRHR